MNPSQLRTVPAETAAPASSATPDLQQWWQTVQEAFSGILTEAARQAPHPLAS